MEFTKQDIYSTFEGKENIPDFVNILKKWDEMFYKTEFIHNDKKCVAIRSRRDGYCIKIEIPKGYTIDDLNLQVSFGDGYIDMENI